jgi:hypothetical protein
MPYGPSSLLVDADPVARVTAKCSSSMSETCPHDDARELANAAHCSTVCDKFLVGLVLYTLVRSSEALAGEQGSNSIRAMTPDFGALHPFTTKSLSVPPLPDAFRMPDSFRASSPPEAANFSSTEFRPRAHSTLDAGAHGEAVDEAPMLRSTTVWQRMKDYRTRDRVRLLTLWESGASTVSLQAGKKGDPSLQWTSRWMNRGGATRGLLDQLFSISFAGARNGLQNSARPTSARPAITPNTRLDVGNTK